jgi:hypothetical protein
VPLRKPEQFQKEGSAVFRNAPVDKDAIAGWVAIAGDKAKDSLNKDNSASTRLGTAYDSVLNLSLAVLCAKGWRTTSADGHHAQSLEAACAYASVSVTAFDDMDAVRDIRNQQYGGIAPSEADVKLAVKSMNRIAPELLQMLSPFLSRKT